MTLMDDWMGPEKIVQIYDPSVGLKAFVVVDNTLMGPGAGGLRMLPDVSVEEVARLARTMTYKYGIFDMPVGGAKAGIRADPSAQNKRLLLHSFALAISHLIEGNLYFPGPDMGTDNMDIRYIYQVVGKEKYMPSDLYLKEIDGIPFEEHITGYGVVCAAEAGAEFAGFDFKGSTLALEGLGKVGSGVALHASKNGAKLVAVSTVLGAIYNPDGLDVSKLLQLKKEHGDRVVLEYSDAERIPKEELFTLPVDTLVPGARPDVINSQNADNIRAKLICPGANIPVTPEAEKILLRKGVVSVPDFIANGGGVLTGYTEKMEDSINQSFKFLRETVQEKTREVLEAAKSRGEVPRRVAEEIVEEKIRRALKRRRKRIEKAVEKLKTQLHT
ncbi:MAG: Glu/Leu/Phe/Val family dehydrogenase [Candidatus Freyarchaeota archaeon]